LFFIVWEKQIAHFLFVKFLLCHTLSFLRCGTMGFPIIYKLQHIQEKLFSRSCVYIYAALYGLKRRRMGRISELIDKVLYMYIYTHMSELTIRVESNLYKSSL
jgi:hypothetical protein